MTISTNQPFPIPHTSHILNPLEPCFSVDCCAAGVQVQAGRSPTAKRRTTRKLIGGERVENGPGYRFGCESLYRRAEYLKCRVRIRKKHGRIIRRSSEILRNGPDMIDRLHLRCSSRVGMLLQSSKLRDVLERRVTLLVRLYDCPEHRTHNDASCMSGLLGAEQKTVLKAG